MLLAYTEHRRVEGKDATRFRESMLPVRFPRNLARCNGANLSPALIRRRYNASVQFKTPFSRRRPLWDTGMPADPGTGSFCFRQWGCQTSYDTASRCYDRRASPGGPDTSSFFLSPTLSLSRSFAPSFFIFLWSGCNQSTERGYCLTFVACIGYRRSTFRLQLPCANAEACVVAAVWLIKRVSTLWTRGTGCTGGDAFGNERASEINRDF